jgi:hypothetical protein
MLIYFISVSKKLTSSNPAIYIKKLNINNVVLEKCLVRKRGTKTAILMAHTTPSHAK